MRNRKRLWQWHSLILVTLLLAGCAQSLPQPTAIPTPLSTATPAVKPSSIPTWTPTATLPPTPIPTATSTSTHTPVPTPTDTPVPPTATPTPVVVAHPPEDWPYAVVAFVERSHYDSHRERWSTCFHGCDTAPDFTACADACPTLYFFTGTHYVRALFGGMSGGGSSIHLISSLETYDGEFIVLVELPSGMIVPTTELHVRWVE